MRFSALALCLLLLPTLAVAATDPKQRQQQLQQQITELVKELESEKNRYSEHQKKLAKIERSVQRQSRALRELDQQVAQAQSRLAALEHRQSEQQQQLQQQRVLLASQLRASWLTGNQERLQLWLSGADLSMFGPVLTWYEYLNNNRVGNVVDLAAELEQLAQTEAELLAVAKQKNELRDQAQKKSAELASARKQRQELLGSSKARIAAEQNQLKQLKKEQAELTALIKRLQEMAAKAPPAPPPSKPFARLRGQLRWPAKGKIVADYGAPRADGRLKWNGVTIKSPAGSKVKAVAGGEVIFADWLGRLGLLMIIDHGDNYLSLYGHNQALYKKPGDKVSADELIASVGDSGGRSEAGLYFEIRQGSKFRNPHLWCKQAAL